MPWTAKVLSSNLTWTFFQRGNILFQIKFLVNYLSAYLFSAQFSHLRIVLLRAFSFKSVLSVSYTHLRRIFFVFFLLR